MLHPSRLVDLSQEQRRQASGMSAVATGLGTSILSLGSDLLCLIQRLRSSSPSSDLRNGVEEDLGKLKEFQRRIQAVLHDAGRREIRDETDKLWLKELKDVAYDAEDVLDEYHYQVLQAQAEGTGEPSPQKRKRCEEEVPALSYPSSPLIIAEQDRTRKFGGSLDEISVRIKQIFKNFNEISEARSYLCLKETAGESRVDGTWSHPPQTGSVVNESSIVGRQKEKREVISFLLSENRGDTNVSVISIVGMGGKGKTTLAQLAYNDVRVGKHFNRRGWVCVPPDFDITKLTRSILEAVTMKACGLTELSTLQQTLKNELWQKKVLLVLDSLWDMQRSCWESLILPFVDAEKVRIIVTTRHQVVAENTRSRSYHLIKLSDDECLSLFKCFAFGGKSCNEQPYFVEVGKQIVSKCGGLPLAVKALAGLLQNNIEGHYWNDVLESEIWELDRENEILPALRLSYRYLPVHLKPLFLFCSMFPKDYLFEKDELVRFWMAHNYIQPRGRERLEDIGQEYFNELCRRSFFDVVGKTTKYRMHDMIRNLAQSISERESHAVLRKEQVDISDEVRHLYVKGKGEIMESLRFNKPSALRTLLCERLDAIVPRIPSVLPKMRCLQHVFSDSFDDPNICYLAKLIHLRYLHVYNKEIGLLPESLCRLYNLQSLNLDNCENLKELPSGIGKLVNLRYIGLSNLNIEKLPDSICLLSNLQKLRLSDCKSIKELPSGIGSLDHLRYLQLCDTEIRELPETICELENLELLELTGCQNLSKLPSCIGDLSKLLTLEITNTEIDELPESLCRLSKLQRLNLYGNWNLKDLPNGFANLVSLCYLDLSNTGFTAFPRCISALYGLRYVRYDTR